jgi:hypothetical protein
MAAPSYLHLNPFRVVADLAHILSKCILIWSIHWNKSAEGVSLLTQVLYTLVFITRYIDLVEPADWEYWYLPFFKIFYIASSLYTMILMVKVYPRTREKETAWKIAFWSVLGSAISAPLILYLLYERIGSSHWFLGITWTFSIILESVCVLPQLLLLRQTTVPTVIDSYYLVTLGSYRALYILNWLVRGFGPEKHWDPIPDFFGVVQTALYVDFAWMYYSRQRVKLRNGGIVDSDDFRKGWLLRGLTVFR